MTELIGTQTIQLNAESWRYHDLPQAAGQFGVTLDQVPFCIRVLAANLLPALDRGFGQAEDLGALLRREAVTIPFFPARMLLQDLLGVPVLVDLAAMRDRMAELGADPSVIDAAIPVDFVVDHSLKVVHAGSADAQARNEEIEAQQNAERFAFLRWCQTAFKNVRIIPPGSGILHQINIENLARVVWADEESRLLYPDTVLGTDSHTPMVNGLGVVGWGVGGLEAEAATLGRPVWVTVPPVVGVRLHGKTRAGTTATDIVLHITERLRAHGVVGKFVEFHGEGLGGLAAADRSTIANMAPEYGATCVYFPIDTRVIEYLALTGRSKEQRDLVEAYAKAQNLWRSEGTAAPVFDENVEIDLADIRPSISGPRRPQDRIDLEAAASALEGEYEGFFALKPDAVAARHDVPGRKYSLGHGDVVIAAITSCTNTSNPRNMIAAGLLAKAAAEKGLEPKPWVKTSFAPGSLAVPKYLERAGLSSALEALGFQIVGFGCTTCNGMSGGLDEAIEQTIRENDLVAVAVLSGNRNFEARVHPLCRANYLASPALVIAYAIAGSMGVDLTREPLGEDRDGNPVLLSEIWPTDQQIDACLERCVSSDVFGQSSDFIARRIDEWSGPAEEAELQFRWAPDSTYIRKPPFVEKVDRALAPIGNLKGLRPLAVLGDSITTDHISPSGAILPDSSAGRFLISHGVTEKDFNSYGTRRGNHEVAMRATFANIRLRNELVPGVEGSYAKLMPEGETRPIFEVAETYASRGEECIILAGKEYGCGSSRDWAAKGVRLVGVRAIVAESYERIHRSNLIGAGVLPLLFQDGQTRADLGLTGAETLTVSGISETLSPQMQASLIVERADGSQDTYPVTVALNNEDEVLQIAHGGLMPLVVRSALG